MREPLFCPAGRGIPAPSAKNSHMAGGWDSVFVGAHGDAPFPSLSGSRFRRDDGQMSQ